VVSGNSPVLGWLARLGQLEVPRHLPIERSPARQRSTISAWNSRVNDRWGRRVFRSIVSIMDILSSALHLTLDVRQTGISPLVIGPLALCHKPLGSAATPSTDDTPRIPTPVV
jgi:hypothetical protein